MDGREQLKRGVAGIGRDVSGQHNNRLRTFIGDRVTRAETTGAMLLERNRRTLAQVRDFSDADWGKLIPIEGIDY